MNFTETLEALFQADCSHEQIIAVVRELQKEIRVPVSADTLALLMAKGIKGGDLIEVVRAIDADSSDSEREITRLRIQSRGSLVDVFQKTGGHCAYCGTPLFIRGREGKRVTIDHVIPLSKGGSNEIENLVPACKNCNSAKRDRDLEDFRRSHGPFAFAVGGQR